ncbi:MAG: hypothetical protein CL940_06085 [Deltaproteobacteria bacterium]|mgnify:FL=1|nr:hypothetical protein [Deltaproteobacteria bacterium]
MSKKTPKQLVEAKFGTRGDLVDAILKLTGDGGDSRSSLMGTTNKKLLRIHEVAQEVSDKHGGKSGLIDAIAGLQFKSGKPNAGWREKMEGKTVKFLLDHHRQLSTRG